VLNDDGAYEDQSAEHKDLFDRAWASNDVIEAQVARVEKRTARFRGV
jgi:enoyl-CoA hydratase